MERKDVIELVKEVHLYYGMRGKSEQEIIRQINNWEPRLKELDKEVVLSNFKEHIQKSTFPPELADLVKKPKPAEKERNVPGAKETIARMEKYDQPPGCTWEEVEEELEDLCRKMGIKYE